MPTSQENQQLPASAQRDTRDLFRRVSALERVPTFGIPQWPMAYELINPMMAAFPGYDNGATGGFSTVVYDNTYYRGFYLETTGQDDLFRVIVRLGPSGSIWGIRANGASGVDYGILSVRVASLTYQDEGYPGTLGNPTGALASAFEANEGFFDVSPSASEMDFYQNPGNVPFVPLGVTPQWRMTGNDGAFLTQDATFGDTYFEINGGAGLYAIQFQVSDKNVSSSGYRIRLSSVWLTRFTDDSFPIL